MLKDANSKELVYILANPTYSDLNIIYIAYFSNNNNISLPLLEAPPLIATIPIAITPTTNIPLTCININTLY